jgi:hypothetical protein
MDEDLKRLVADVQDARRRLEDGLRLHYPAGTHVGVRLKHGQKNPTWGVVYSHWSGNLQVEFALARKPYRMISPEDVMQVGVPRSSDPKASKP